MARKTIGSSRWGEFAKSMTRKNQKRTEGTLSWLGAALVIVCLAIGVWQQFPVDTAQGIVGPAGSMTATALLMKGNETKSINSITVVDSGAEITAANDIQILIPAAFVDTTWDTADTTATVDTTGNTTGTVSSTVSYATTNYVNDTLVLDVTADFTSGDQVIISDLSLVSANPGTDNSQTLNWSVDAGVSFGAGAATVTVDTTPPTVTDANISISGGSGTGGAYKIGDSIVVTWDNSAGGDNNADVASAAADLSGWGGGAAVAMNDTGAGCDLFAADDSWCASYNIAGTEGIDSAGVDATITVTDTAGNITGPVSDTTGATVDTIAPIITDPGTLSISTDNGVTSVAALNDGATDQDKVTLSGVTLFAADGDAIEIDLTALTGEATLAMGAESGVVIAGALDSAAQTFTITATDDAGNLDTISSTPISVDNIAPTVTAGYISVAGAAGTGGAFKNGDTAVPTWNDSETGDDNSDTIASVSFDASDFRAADTSVAGVDTVNIWTGTLTGALDSQDDLNNNITVTVTDDGGNITTVTGTNDYTIDTIVPSFAAANPVVALLQGGGATTSPTRQWYYYDGKLLRIQVTNIAESDGNPLAEVKACLRSMKDDNQATTCDSSDFNTAANYDSLTVGSATTSTSNYTLDAANLGALPTLKGGYPVNIQLVDDAGNTTESTVDAETFIAIWNVDPKNEDATIDNTTTTDWSTIADFTAVSGLVFNAQVALTDVARYTFTGPLDLTDSTTIAGLQSFATNVTTTPDVMKIRSDNLPALDAAATVMVKMSSAVQPGFAVKNNAGTVLGYIPNNAGALDSYTIGGKTIDNFSWNGGVQELTFDTTGFSEYDSDNTAPTATFSPTSGSLGVATTADIVVTFSEAMDTSSLTYTLAPNPGGLSVAWSAGDTVATVSHTALNPVTSYTFTVTAATDKVGNAATGTLVTTFSTAGGGGGGGGGGGAAPLTTITVGAPNGGESWAGGSSHNITWSSTGSTISKIKLFYSTDRGVNFPNTIAVDEMNDGSYSWTVPNISSGTVKVKVGGYDASGNLVVADVSDSDFTITYTTPDVSSSLSAVAASPVSVVADGVTLSTITVTVKNSAGTSMSGKTVVLSSSRSAQDSVTTVTGVTGSDGKAIFKVSSATAGTSTYTAAVNSTTINQTASVTFTAPAAPELSAGEKPVVLNVGDLIKSELSSTVYYYGSDNKRHIFPNQTTYNTWYLDWSGVKTVPASQLQGIPLGHNVTVRPGTVLVKIETDPKVYAVEPGGVLRWVPTEARAISLYGSEWAKRVVDIPLVSWTDYTFGTDITTDTHPTGCLIKYSGMSETYYIQGSQKRLVTSTSAFSANNFRTENVLVVPTTFYYVAGADIVGAEPSLMQIY